MASDYCIKCKIRVIIMHVRQKKGLLITILGSDELSIGIAMQEFSGLPLIRYHPSN